MQGRHPIWYGIGFGVVPFLVLFLGYLNIHPELYRGIPLKFHADHDGSWMNIDWGDDEKDDPPLEYVSDGFKGISILTRVVEVKSFWDLWNAPPSEVSYEWRYKVKNLTDENRDISVTYQLVGKDADVLASSVASKLAEPGETIEFEETGQLDYQSALRVTGSSWSIANRVAP